MQNWLEVRAVVSSCLMLARPVGGRRGGRPGGSDPLTEPVNDQLWSFLKTTFEHRLIQAEERTERIFLTELGHRRLATLLDVLVRPLHGRGDDRAAEGLKCSAIVEPEFNAEGDSLQTV